MKSKSLIVAIGLAALFLLGFLLARGAGGGTISGAEARRLVENGARLVDVRTPGEFAVEHIPGAVNIPVQDLDRRMGELEPKDQSVVVYCGTGNRSGRAASMLRDAGYTKVHDLGPMSQW